MKERSRDLVDLERCLGLRSQRGISRQKNADSPPIAAVLDRVKVFSKDFVDTPNPEIRTSRRLYDDTHALFEAHGPQIWPGPEVPRPVWLAEPSTEEYDGRYPRHLYYTDSTDREVLWVTFYQLVVQKVCNYHDNQYQKRRRSTAKSLVEDDDEDFLGNSNHFPVEVDDYPDTYKRHQKKRRSNIRLSTEDSESAPDTLDETLQSADSSVEYLETRSWLPINNGNGSRTTHKRKRFSIEDQDDDDDDDDDDAQYRGSKRFHVNREQPEEENSLVVKFKVNKTQLARIILKGFGPMTAPSMDVSGARTRASSVAGSTHPLEDVQAITQYQDSKGKWYEVTDQTRPYWAINERIRYTRPEKPRRTLVSRHAALSPTRLSVSESRESFGPASVSSRPSSIAEHDAYNINRRDSVRSSQQKEMDARATRLPGPSQSGDTANNPREAVEQPAKESQAPSKLEASDREQTPESQLNVEPHRHSENTTMTGVNNADTLLSAMDLPPPETNTPTAQHRQDSAGQSLAHNTPTPSKESPKAVHLDNTSPPPDATQTPKSSHSRRSSGSKMRDDSVAVSGAATRPSSPSHSAGPPVQKVVDQVPERPNSQADPPHPVESRPDQPDGNNALQSAPETPNPAVLKSLTELSASEFRASSRTRINLGVPAQDPLSPDSIQDSRVTDETARFRFVDQNAVFPRPVRPVQSVPSAPPPWQSRYASQPGRSGLPPKLTGLSQGPRRNIGLRLLELLSAQAQQESSGQPRPQMQSQSGSHPSDQSDPELDRLVHDVLGELANSPVGIYIQEQCPALSRDKECLYIVQKTLLRYPDCRANIETFKATMKAQLDPNYDAPAIEKHGDDSNPQQPDQLPRQGPKPDQTLERKASIQWATTAGAERSEHPKALSADGIPLVTPRQSPVQREAAKIPPQRDNPVQQNTPVQREGPIKRDASLHIQRESPGQRKPPKSTPNNIQAAHPPNHYQRQEPDVGFRPHHPHHMSAQPPHSGYHGPQPNAHSNSPPHPWVRAPPPLQANPPPPPPPPAPQHQTRPQTHVSPYPMIPQLQGSSSMQPQLRAHMPPYPMPLEQNANLHPRQHPQAQSQSFAYPNQPMPNPPPQPQPEPYTRLPGFVKGSKPPQPQPEPYAGLPGFVEASKPPQPQHMPTPTPSLAPAVQFTPQPRAVSEDTHDDLLNNTSIEIKWGREEVDYTDHITFQECKDFTTAAGFFGFFESRIPDEVKGCVSAIKEIRVKAVDELQGKSRLPRLVRSNGSVYAGLRSLGKTLKAQTGGTEMELEILVVWE